MTAEELVFSACHQLFDGRMFPEHLPEQTPFPCAIYTRGSGRFEGTVCADDETPRILIFVYADYPADCRRLVKRIQTALRELPQGTAEQDNPPDYGFHYELRAHFAALDYLVSVE